MLFPLDMLTDAYRLKIKCRLTLAVTDVLQARISETAGFAGLAKCGWSGAWEWHSHDLAPRNPSRPQGGVQ